MVTWLLVELVLVVVAGSLTVWGMACVRRYRGEAVVPYSPHSPVPWGVVHLVVLAAAVLLLQSMAWLTVTDGPGTELSDLEPAEQLQVTAAVGLASLIATLAGAALLIGTSGAGRRDLGLPDSWATLLGDLKLGLLGFLAAALPVYAIQVLIVVTHHGLGEEPADHPLVKMLKEGSGNGTLTVAVMVAVLVAPIFEEFLFRLVLQGWLEKLAAMWAGSRAEDAVAAPSESVVMEPTIGDQTAAPLPFPADSSDLQAQAARPRPPAVWPIVGSSAMFAAMHLGHGFDPIPLFFLALGLGYLYHRTHRIVPCIAMHAVFNAFSLALMGLDGMT